MKLFIFTVALFSSAFFHNAYAGGVVSLSGTYSDRKEYVYPSLGFSVYQKISRNVFSIGSLSGSFSDNDYPQNPETQYYYAGSAGMGYEFNKKFNMTLSAGFFRDELQVTQGILKITANYQLW